LAPLPAVLSRDQVHAVRSYNTVIPLIIVLSFGLITLINLADKISNPILHATYYMLLASAYLASLVYFLDSYFVHLPKHDSKYWEYGYREIVETITPIQKKYQKIKVQQSFSQPYIYFLFYGAAADPQKYDPVKYQRQAKLVESEYKGDVGYVTKLDNIEFAPIDWSANRGEKGTLFVADPIRIPPEDSSNEDLFTLIKEIRYLDGNTAFRIIEVK
jgi:hypothetical protein